MCLNVIMFYCYFHTAIRKEMSIYALKSGLVDGTSWTFLLLLLLCNL